MSTIAAAAKTCAVPRAAECAVDGVGVVLKACAFLDSGCTVVLPDAGHNIWWEKLF